MSETSHPEEPIEEITSLADPEEENSEEPEVEKPFLYSTEVPGLGVLRHSKEMGMPRPIIGADGFVAVRWSGHDGAINFQDGALRNSTLEGPGYLEVENPGGELLATYGELPSATPSESAPVEDVSMSIEGVGTLTWGADMPAPQIRELGPMIAIVWPDYGHMIIDSNSGEVINSNHIRGGRFSLTNNEGKVMLSSSAQELPAGSSAQSIIVRSPDSRVSGIVQSNSSTLPK